MNCVERVQRENVMLASFLGNTHAFLDDSGRIVLQMPGSFALMMADTPAARDLLCRSMAPELKRTPSPSELVLEAPDEKSPVKDTVLDDLLDAASGETNE
jgi:hypothetical protein